MYGCGEQEVGVASGSVWNLWVWLLGVVLRRYIDFLILLIPTPLVSVLFCSSIPTSFFILLKMRDSVPSASYSSVCNVLRQWNIPLIPTYRVYRLYDIYIYIYIYREREREREREKERERKRERGSYR